MLSMDFCEARVLAPRKIMWYVEDGFPGRPTKDKWSHHGPGSWLVLGYSKVSPGA